jgi:hypothetical protein
MRSPASSQRASPPFLSPSVDIPCGFAPEKTLRGLRCVPSQFRTASASPTSGRQQHPGGVACRSAALPSAETAEDAEESWILRNLRLVGLDADLTVHRDHRIHRTSFCVFCAFCGHNSAFSASSADGRVNLPGIQQIPAIPGRPLQAIAQASPTQLLHGVQAAGEPSPGLASQRPMGRPQSIWGAKPRGKAVLSATPRAGSSQHRPSHAWRGPPWTSIAPHNPLGRTAPSGLLASFPTPPADPCFRWNSTGNRGLGARPADRFQEGNDPACRRAPIWLYIHDGI